MMEKLELTILMGGVVSLLMGIVTYFLRQLLADFKRVEQEVIQVKNTLEVIRTEFNGLHSLLNQRINFQDKRVDRLEHQTFQD